LNKDVLLLLALKGMKKNHLLKLATIIAFAAFIIDVGGPAFKEGLVDGFQNKYENPNAKTSNSMPVTVDAKVLLPHSPGIIKIDASHSLQPLRVDAVLKNSADEAWYLTIINFITVFFSAAVMIGIIFHGYNIIKAISSNEAFSGGVIKNLNYLSYYLFAFFVFNGLYEIFIMQSGKMMAGSIPLVNTIEWHLEFLVGGFVVLLIAQAFKQGMVLQEEQSLTI
jgi:Protein of unknown function (DUF2975)